MYLLTSVPLVYIPTYILSSVLRSEMNVRLLIFCWYSITIIQAFLHRRYIQRFFRPLVSEAEEAGDALFLTPLIEAGELALARQQAFVPPLVDNIRSYAGFFTVDKKTKSHLYFWFIPTTKVDYTSTPLILWLQGGPGCSSLFGLFGENGPFEVTKEGAVRRRDIAWTDHYHMLYVDQPVGSGFSFTENDGYVRNEKEVAEHLYKALVQFYQLFPEWRDVEFYIAGESYAGKYIPAIGYKIHVANQQPNALNIPLKGLMIGNGLSDPESMLTELADYLQQLGFVEDNERMQIEFLQTQVVNFIRSEQWFKAVDQYGEMWKLIESATNITNVYDYTEENSPDFEPPFAQFISRGDVRQIIHAGRSPYEMCSESVNEYLTEDFLQSVRPWVEALLEHYPILFYSGQLDVIVAHVMTANMIRTLNWSGAADYYLAEKQILRMNDSVSGFYKFSSNLVYSLVCNAGHMVPADQPEVALALIDMFVQNRSQYSSTTKNSVDVSSF